MIWVLTIRQQGKIDISQVNNLLRSHGLKNAQQIGKNRVYTIHIPDNLLTKVKGAIRDLGFDVRANPDLTPIPHAPKKEPRLPITRHIRRVLSRIQTHDHDDLPG